MKMKCDVILKELKWNWSTF